MGLSASSRMHYGVCGILSVFLLCNFYLRIPTQFCSFFHTLLEGIEYSLVPFFPLKGEKGKSMQLKSKPFIPVIFLLICVLP